MNRLAKPFPLTAGFLAVTIGLAFTKLAETAVIIGGSFVLFLSVLFIHEAGHALFGKVAGYRFHYLAVGPILIEKNPTLKIKANDNWLYFGGVTSSTPDTGNIDDIISKHKWFVIGGPFVSALASFAGLVVWYIGKIDAAMFFSLLNAVIFIVTVLPYKGAMKSDGRVFLELSKGGKPAAEFLLDLLLLKEIMSPKEPSEWSEELIIQGQFTEPESEKAATGLILFYHTLLKQGYDQATLAVEPYKQLEVTNKNKVPLQFFSHLKQIDALLSGERNRAIIEQQHKLLSSFEPISYKRSEAILAYLKGDNERAKQKLQEVARECKKSMEAYGFFQAELQLTLFLSELLFSEKEQIQLSGVQ